ncbi:hypothetical protein WJX84_007803 [Apatococcus fuscideae]|uniref:Fungal lipase-type domain-containing protein n=1 Tax=Apatococcus fuscideae TaxID=2026836 RepID=A0AAW1T6R5_9CHLO
MQALDLQKNLHVQEAINSLLLSECAYKLSRHELESPLQAAERLATDFPHRLVSIRSIQCCRETALHRCLLAEDGNAIYMAFMGTKEWRDYLTDAAFHQGPMILQADNQAAQGASPAAHQGFSSRAQTVRIENLYRHTCQQGKALVLCGHSLGAAVAMLCALRLHALQQHQGGRAKVRCYTFGAPAIGNQALAGWVSSSNFHHDFHNFILPEDPVPRMLALQAKPSLPGLANDSQVEVLTADEVPFDASPPAHPTWRTSFRNALPNALPWRRWRTSSQDATADQPSVEVYQGGTAEQSQTSPADVDVEQQESTPEQESIDPPESTPAIESGNRSPKARWRVRLPALPNLIPAAQYLPTGFLPMPKIPYQSYAHFGWTHELAGPDATPDQQSPDGVAEGRGFKLLAAQGVLSLWEAVQLRMHRMPAYRERISALVAAALTEAGNATGMDPVPRCSGSAACGAGAPSEGFCSQQLLGQPDGGHARGS